MNRATETLRQFEARLDRATGDVATATDARLEKAYEDAMLRALNAHGETLEKATAITLEAKPPGMSDERYQKRIAARIRALYRKSGLLRDIARAMKAFKAEARRIVEEANDQLREINREEYHGEDRFS